MGPKKHPLQTAADQAADALARRRAQCRRAQARYKQTAKGRATDRRYRDSPAGRVMSRVVMVRYRATPRGQQVNADHNARRIFIGERYRGKVQTPELATVIRRHIQERLRAFERQQTRAET